MTDQTIDKRIKGLEQDFARMLVAQAAKNSEHEQVMSEVMIAVLMLRYDVLKLQGEVDCTWEEWIEQDGVKGELVPHSADMFKASSH